MHLVSKGQAWVKGALTVGIGGQGELPEPARLREADLQGTGLGYESRASCGLPVGGSNGSSSARDAAAMGRFYWCYGWHQFFGLQREVKFKI